MRASERHASSPPKSERDRHKNGRRAGAGARRPEPAAVKADSDTCYLLDLLRSRIIPPGAGPRLRCALIGNYAVTTANIMRAINKL
ncbi:hypothetical protein EVAR_18668_1 [Eumeta japonica]|uniref:Uncharacterized protein n=1 Tax=Eumeta variegata TaxID=151549 RepID=A0A4C1U7G0_EUMVA|nr:hypothetical protein EVAR_18668_1 [Eumeta japonica]